MSLSVLDEPRTFPPKIFFLIVWIGTLLFALFGVAVSRPFSVPFWIWLLVTLVAVRQIWRTQWTRLDRDGMTVRNIFGWKRSLRWTSITRVDLKRIGVRRQGSFSLTSMFNGGRTQEGTTPEMPRRSSAFSILTVEGVRDGADDGKTTRLVIDSDTVGFETLGELVQGAVPGVPTSVDAAH